jgi:hypothetical protein
MKERLDTSIWGCYGEEIEGTRLGDNSGSEEYNLPLKRDKILVDDHLRNFFNSNRDSEHK